MDEIKSRLINLALSKDFYNALLVFAHAVLFLFRKDLASNADFQNAIAAFDGLFLVVVNILTRTAPAKTASTMIRARLTT